MEREKLPMTHIKAEPMTPNKNNLSINQTSSFSTPIPKNKENTPKNNISLQLNNSAMLQTSYTPKVVARTQMRVTQMLCKTMTPKTPGKLNTNTASSSKDSPASIYRTPSSVLSEMNRSNLIDMQTPFAGPSKNMFLLDLTSPHQLKTPSKKTPRTNRTITSTPKNCNNLLKSAIKNTITQSAKKAFPIQSSFQKARRSIAEIASQNSSCIEVESSMETTIEISDSDTGRSCNTTTVSKSISNEEMFAESKDVPTNDIKEQAKQDEPKNDLTDVYGVKRMMRTPARVPKDDLTDVVGIKKLMQTPGRGPINDLSDIEGVAELMKTPKRVPQISISKPSDEPSTESPTTSVLNRTFEIESSEAIENVFNSDLQAMEDSPVTLLSEIGEEELMTAEQQFDSLSGMSTSKISQVDTANEKTSCERVLNWIADTKKKLVKENNMEQILSTRYSNVTPNESIVGGGDAVSTNKF